MMTPDAFAAAAHVSRETMDRLMAYDRVLTDWSDRHNLIARSTMDDRWARHYLDSAQLFALIPAAARTLVDLGSGAGFPGLVLAAMGAAQEGQDGRENALQVTLIEATGKKAAFLSAAAAAMGLEETVTVIPARVESPEIKGKVGPPDIITARALARLEKLFGYAAGIQGRNTTLLFSKGARAEEELTEARKSWRMEVTRHPSKTDPGATILEISDLVPRQ